MIYDISLYYINLIILEILNFKLIMKSPFLLQNEIIQYYIILIIIYLLCNIFIILYYKYII